MSENLNVCDFWFNTEISNNTSNVLGAFYDTLLVFFSFVGR